MADNVSKNLKISVSMNTDQFQRETRNMRRVLYEAKRDLRDYTLQIAALDEEYKAGRVTNEEYIVTLNKLELKREKQTKKINEEIDAVNRLKMANTAAARAAEEVAQKESAARAASGDKEFGDDVKRLRAEDEELRQRIARSRNEEFGDEVKRLRQEAIDLAAEEEANRQRLARIRNDEFGDEVKRLRAEEEARRRLAQSVRESLALQRQEAYERSRNMEASVNPSLQRQDLLGDLSAARAAGGLSRRGAQTLANQEGIQYMRQFYTERQRVNAALREANSLYRAGVISQNQYAQATERIRFQASLTAKAIDQMKMAASGILAPIAIAYASFQAIQKVVQDTIEFENAQANFRVFTGSAQGANEVLADLRDLSSNSPVGFSAAQKSTRTLLQYGVAAKDATAITRQLAEVAGGNAERMENLSLAMAQVVSAGRLMGQENIQLVNAGFSPLFLLSEKTGKSMAQLKREMEAGAISSEKVLQVLKESTSEGGRFFGLLAEMSETTGGKFNKLSSEIDMLSISLGKLAKPGTIEFLGNLTDAVKTLRIVAETPGVDSLLSDSTTKSSTWLTRTGVFEEFLRIQQQILGETEKEAEVREKNLEQERELMGIRDRVSQSFTKLIAKQEEAFISAQYEKDVAERVLAIREQSTDEERKLVDEIIARNGSYEELIFSVNFLAAAAAEELRKEQEKTAELEKQRKLSLDNAKESAKAMDDLKAASDKNKEEIESAKSRLQYEQEILKFGTLIARIRQLERDKKFDRRDAEQLAMEERKLEVQKKLQEFRERSRAIQEANNPNAEFVKTMAELEALRAANLLGDADYEKARQRALNQATQGAGGVNAAPVAEKGSQEAYQALTGQTVDKINTQIKIQEQQKILDENRNKILERANILLDEIAKQKIKKVGP